MTNTALQRAIDIAGSQRALAAAIGKKQGHVWDWLNLRRHVPAEMAIPIEAAVGGRVTRHELRPDLYPTPAPSEGSEPAGADAGLRLPVETSGPAVDGGARAESGAPETTTQAAESP